VQDPCYAPPSLYCFALAIVMLSVSRLISPLILSPYVRQAAESMDNDVIDV